MAVVKYLFLKEIKLSGLAMLVVVSFFVASVGNGDIAEANNKSLIELGGLLAKLDNYEGQFTQLVYGPRGQILQDVEGSFLVKRPHFFKWEVREPFPQVVITQGTQLIIYDPDLEQATVRSIDSALVDTPASLLTGNIEQLRQGFVVSSEDSGEANEYRLVPRSQDSLFEELRLSFNNGNLNRLEIIDHMSQITIIQFRNVILNDALTVEDFTFKLPPGTDVIGDVISP